MLLPKNEISRLSALYRLEILDTEEEEFFDDITKAAAKTMNTPHAFIAFIDKDRAFFKSSFGMPDGKRPADINREFAFCSYTILNAEHSLTVPDTFLDSRFEDNPQVISAWHTRFYFGMPIVTKEQEAIGALYVVDKMPRPEPSIAQKEAMGALTSIIMFQLEMRENLIKINDAVKLIKTKSLPVELPTEIGISFQELNRRCDNILAKIKLRHERQEAMDKGENLYKQ